jgi:hypothetical protein
MLGQYFFMTVCDDCISTTSFFRLAKILIFERFLFWCVSEYKCIWTIVFLVRCFGVQQVCPKVWNTWMSDCKWVQVCQCCVCFVFRANMFFSLRILLLKEAFSLYSDYVTSDFSMYCSFNESHLDDGFIAAWLFY